MLPGKLNIEKKWWFDEYTGIGRYYGMLSVFLVLPGKLNIWKNIDLMVLLKFGVVLRC